MNIASMDRAAVGATLRRVRPFVAAVLATLALACADKVLTPAAAGSRKLMLRISAMNIPPSRDQAAATPKYLLGIVAYATATDTNILGYGYAPITGTTGQVSVSADLTQCLADPTRSGSHSACSILVAVAITDTMFTRKDSSGNGNGNGNGNGDGVDPFRAAYDYVILGPFDAAPGSAPVIPAIDLSTTRFTAHDWVPDPALMLGGTEAPSQSVPAGVANSTVSGYVNGTTPPTLYAISRDSFGNPALAVFQSGTWSVLQNKALANPGSQSPGQQSFFTNYQNLAVVSPTEVWLAGSNGMWRFDGTNYTQVGGNTSSLTSIAVLNTGGTGRIVWGVGLNGTVYQSNGTTLQQFSLGSNEPLNSVCVTGANEAFIAGANGTLWRYNGTSWTTTPSAASGPKVGLQCPGSGQAFVIAQGQPTTLPTLLNWNGSSWVAMPTSGLNGVSLRGWGVVSPSEIYGYADSASTVRIFYKYGGTSWAEIGRRSFTNTGPAAMWADPRGGAAYLLSSFARLEMASPSGVSVQSYTPDLRDVSMNSPTSAFAVGWNDFLARWDGQSWTVDKPPSGTATIRILNAVWSDGPNNAWAVGNGADILRWNGSSWTVVSDALRPVDAAIPTFNGVWGSGSTVLVAGANGIIRCAGTSCAHDQVPSTGALFGVWGSSASNVFAVGASGTILHYTGSTWTTMSSPTARTLVRVWGSSATDVYALGDSTLLHYNGTAWTSIPMTGDLADVQSSTSPPYLQGVFQLGLWGAGPNEVYVGGDHGQLVRWDGTGWRQVVNGNGGRRIVGISGYPGLGAMAVTEAQSPFPAGTVWRGLGATGGMFAPMTRPSSWP